MTEHNDMFFDWDEEKAMLNERKHGVSFLEAMTVFDDANAVMTDDTGHSDTEQRFVLLGMSRKTNLLMVCHCYRGNDDIIRLVSARPANNRESKFYGGK